MVTVSYKTASLVVIFTVTFFVHLATSGPLPERYIRSTNDDDLISHDNIPHQDLAIGDEDISPALGGAQNDPLPSDDDQDQSQLLHQESDDQDIDHDVDHDTHRTDVLYDTDVVQSGGSLTGSQISHSDLQPYDGDSQITLDEHERIESNTNEGSEESDLDSRHIGRVVDTAGQQPGPAHEEIDTLHHRRRDLDNATDGHFLLTGEEGHYDKWEGDISTESNRGFLLDGGRRPPISSIQTEVQNGSASSFTHGYMMLDQVTSPQEERQDISEQEATTSGRLDIFHEIHAVSNKDDTNNISDVSPTTGDEYVSPENSHNDGDHMGIAIDKSDGNRHNHGSNNELQSSTQNVDGFFSTTLKPVTETNTPRLAILPTPAHIDDRESQNMSFPFTTPHVIINGPGDTHISGDNPAKSGTGSNPGNTEQSTEGPQDGHIISGEGHIGTGGEIHEGSGNERQDKEGSEETGNVPAGHEGHGEETHENEGQGNEGSGHEETGHGYDGHEGPGGTEHEGDGHEHQGNEHIEGSGTDEENTENKDEKDNSKGVAYKFHTSAIPGVPFHTVEPVVYTTPSHISSTTVNHEHKIESSRTSVPVTASYLHEPSQVWSATISDVDELPTKSIFDSEVSSTASLAFSPTPSSFSSYINPTSSYKPTDINTQYPEPSKLLENIYTFDLTASPSLNVSPTSASSFSLFTTSSPIEASLSSGVSSIVGSSISILPSLVITYRPYSISTQESSPEHNVTYQSTTASTTESEKVKTSKPNTLSITYTQPYTSEPHNRSTTTVPNSTLVVTSITGQNRTPSQTATKESMTTSRASTRESTTTSHPQTRESMATGSVPTRDSMITSRSPTRESSRTSRTPTRESMATGIVPTRDSMITSRSPTRESSRTSRTPTRENSTTSLVTTREITTASREPIRERTTTVRVPLLTIGNGNVKTTTLTTTDGQTTRLTTLLVTKKQETDKPTEKPDFVPTSGRPLTLPGQQTSQSTTANVVVTVTTLRPITSRPHTVITDKTQKPQQTTPPPMFIQIEIRMTWQEFCSMKTNFIASLQEIIRTEKQVIVRDEQFKIQNLPKQYCSFANAITINDDSISRRIMIQMYIVDDAGKIDIQLTYDVSSVIDKGFKDTVFKDKIVNVRVVHHPTDIDQQTPESSARQRESSVTMVVVIASVGGLCCLMLIVLQLVLIHRRISAKSKQRALLKLTQRSMDNVALGTMPKSRPHSGYWNPALEDDDEFDTLEFSHVLNYSTLANFCTDTNGIYDEFQDVPCDNAGLTKLFVGEDDKNRFANVLPHSHSRVKLIRREGDTSDYINASSIKGYRGTSDSYIATQSPLVNTVEDFWRMVWEQNSRTIVMLNPKLPSGKYKQSTCYWPDNLASDNFRQYGDYTVCLKKRDIQKDYIECTLEITEIERNLKREVHHFLLTCWTDNGTPEPLSIVKFVLDTRPYYENNGSPAIVHCGSGTGRTGVLIAIDTCMRMYEKRKHVDVFNCVYRMRKERLGMVQTKEQYSLIYQALNQYSVILGSPSFSTRSSVISLHAML